MAHLASPETVGVLDACHSPTEPPGPVWQLAVLDGRLDGEAAPLVAMLLTGTAITVAPGGGVIADLRLVESIDSSGVSAIIHAREGLRTTGRDLVLRNPPPVLVTLLDLIGSGDMIEPPGELRPCLPPC